MSTDTQLIETERDALVAQGVIQHLDRGLLIKDDIPYEVFKLEIAKLNALHKAIPWMWADLAIYGEAVYGEMYDQVIELSGLHYDTLRNYVVNGRAFPLEERFDPTIVPMSYHDAVRTLPRVWRIFILSHIERDKRDDPRSWTTGGARAWANEVRDALLVNPDIQPGEPLPKPEPPGGPVGGEPEPMMSVPEREGVCATSDPVVQEWEEVDDGEEVGETSSHDDRVVLSGRFTLLALINALKGLLAGKGASDIFVVDIRRLL